MVALGFVLGSLLLAPAPQSPLQSSTDYDEPPFLQAHYPAPDARGVATGDLDGDGDVDVAVACGTEVRVLWGNGKGWIERLDRLDLAALAVEVADLDGDGSADLVVAGNGVAYTLLSDGQGGFATPIPWSIAGPAIVMLAADLDLDTHVDLVVATDMVSGGAPAQVEVLLGNGQGGFLSTAVLAQFKAVSLDVGDVDRDGHIDLLATREGLPWIPSNQPGPYLFRGDGQGGFLLPFGPLYFNFDNSFMDAVLIDLDGDPWLDIALGYLGNGTHLTVLRGGVDLDPTAQVLPLDDHAADLCAGDLDGDGDVDLVARSLFDNGVEVLLNDGSGTLSSQGRIGIGNHPWTSRANALADLDGDGALDLVAASWQDVTLLLGDGAGWFRLPEALPGVGGDLEGASVAIADVDGDGHGDVVSAEGASKTLLGDGQGGFGAALASPGAGGLTLALGDLDKDGHVDLVLGGFAFFFSPGWPPPPPQGGVIALGDGTGLFPGVTALPLGGRAVSPVICDLDHDGDLDVAFADAPGVCILIGDGQGGFSESWIPGSQPYGYCLGAGDIDLDGHVDLALGSSYGGLQVLRGNGLGAFRPESLGGGAGGAACVAIGDLDRDGLPDLAVGGYQYGVEVLWGLGGGLFTPPEPVEDTQFIHPRDLEMADVDGDGASELLVACEGYTHTNTAGGLAVLESTAPRELTWTWSFGHGDGVWSVAVGDLDGNGRLDLVTGSIYVYDYSFRRVTYPVTLFLNQLPPEPTCTGEVTYCVAKLNSAGCLPRICSDGTPTLSGPDDFVVRAERVVSHQYGMLLWSGASATLPFQGGTLCLAAPITRTKAQASGGTPGANDCSGTFAHAFTQAYMSANGLTAGTQIFAQFWSRDLYQLPPTATGLTDALSFTIAP